MRAKAFVQMYPMERQEEDGSLQKVAACQTDFFLADGNSFMAFSGIKDVDPMGYCNLEGIAQAFEQMAVAARQILAQYEAMRFPALNAEMPPEEVARTADA